MKMVYITTILLFVGAFSGAVLYYLFPPFLQFHVNGYLINIFPTQTFGWYDYVIGAVTLCIAGSVLWYSRGL